MPYITFSRFLIVESVPQGESPTGTQLYQALEPLPALCCRPVTIEYSGVKTATELWALLRRVKDDIAKTGEIPLLHFECHGNDDGIGLASKEFVYWEDLCEPLREINILTRMHLFVSVAACMGAYLASQLSPVKRSPFLTVLSTTEELYPDELYRGFHAFYHALLSTGNGNEALKALRRHNEKGMCFSFTDAPHLFKLACQRYFERLCTPEKYQERILDIQAEQQELGFLVADAQAIYAHLVTSEQPSFEKFREQYFMRDLFPENEIRFPITFNEVRNASSAGLNDDGGA